MFEVDMRSHLTNLIPPIGFESLYDLATAHETHYTQLYTCHKKKFRSVMAAPMEREFECLAWTRTIAKGIDHGKCYYRDQNPRLFYEDPELKNEPLPLS